MNGFVFSLKAPTWLKNELKEGIIPGGQGQDDSEDDSDSEEADSETEETDNGKVVLLQFNSSLHAIRRVRPSFGVSVIK